MSITQGLAHPDQFRANPWNSNVMSPENEAKLDAAVTRLGFFKPIVVRQVPGTDPELEILGGEHRWQAAVRLGLDEIPYISHGVISDDRAKEIGLADNARYGADEATALAAILSSLEEPDEIKNFLPYSDDDVKSIFSSATINLDDLQIEEEFDATAPAESEAPAVKAAKTHSVMRFKVPLADGEKLTRLIDRMQKRHGYTGSDALTNAGDALVHLLASEMGDE